MTRMHKPPFVVLFTVPLTQVFLDEVWKYLTGSSLGL